MNCENIAVMISAYIDGELPKIEEGYLFTHLGSCSECREEFKAQTSIQHEVKINQKEVSLNFEKKVFNSIMKSKKTTLRGWITRPTPAYVNYALGALIILILVISWLQVSSLRQDLNLFQKRYEASLMQMNYQASQMYQMMNSIPAVEIKQY